MSDLTTISTTVDDGILTITINRPDRLNAFTLVMADELEATFDRANHDDGIRAVIVTGAGRAFCAGMDLGGAREGVFGLDHSLTPMLADVDDLEGPSAVGVRDSGGRVTMAIHACRKPVIAAINGPAVGIGATMTLAMDARLMSADARFGLVFGRIGLVPEGTSTWFLPRIVGMPAALDLVYSADILDADAAVDVGLVRSVHPADELLGAARALADRWTAGRSPVATALARQMLYRNSAELDPIEAHRLESLAIFYMSKGEALEGIAAFTEKRPPVFTGAASSMPPFYDEWVSRTGRPSGRA